MMEKLFENKGITIVVVFTLAFVGFFFFGNIFTSSLSLLGGESEKVVYLGKKSDNIYLTSNDDLSDNVKIIVRYIDGSESEPIVVGMSGSGNGSKGYTSELLTFDEYIDKITIISESGSDVNIGKINNGFYALFKMDSAVLGIGTGEERDEVLFLERNGSKVVAREEWDPDFVRKAVEDDDVEYSEIDSVYVYSVENMATGSDLEKIQALGDYQKARCRDVPGVAPISCTVEEVWGDVSYNYIVGSNGVVYQGKVGGNGIAGTHISENSNSISIALIADDSGEFSQTDHVNTLLASLTSINGIPFSSKSITFINSSDSESFDLLTESVFETEVVTPVEIVEASKSSKELFEGDEIVRSDEGVQLLIPKDSSDVTKDVVARVSDLDAEGEGASDKYDSVFVDEAVAEQLVTEALYLDEETKIQPNYIYRINTWDNTDPNRSIPSDYGAVQHWYLEKTKVPEAWKDMGGCVSDNTCGGDGAVKVAVLDTGVAYEDYDYDAGGTYSTVQFDPFYVEVPGVDTQNGTFNEGYDREYAALPEISNISFVNPYDSWQNYSCNDLRLTGGSPDPCNSFEAAKINHANDDHGHGTFVSSIIASNVSDLSPNRVVGISNNIQIMPVKVFTPNDSSMCQDEFGAQDPTCSYALGDFRSIAFSTTIVDGIDHAVANGAKVINMSLGGPGVDSIVEAGIDDAVTAGVLVVVSSGNDNDDAQYYFPANSPGAFTVGSTTPTDTRASYSNYGFVLDLVAPVGDSATTKVSSIRYACSTDSTCSDENDSNLFQTFTSTSSPHLGIGTSYASPQVAAAAALIWSDDPSATLTEVKDALKESATDLGVVGYDQYFGYGLLNVQGAIAREQNVPTPHKLYYAWYGAPNSARQSWILVANPSATETAYFSVTVAGELIGNYIIAPGERIAPQWRGVQGGPVVVTSNIEVYSTQRQVINGSFNEFSAIKEADLTNEYYFSLYNSIDTSASTWIVVANPSETETANVTIDVAGTEMGNYAIPPLSRVAPLWRGVRGGPVVVTSDINVVSSQRFLYGTSFNEYPGLVVGP